MKVCPNCGEQHPDTDLRTMCGRCLTPLQTRGEAPAPQAEEQEPSIPDAARPAELPRAESPAPAAVDAAPPVTGRVGTTPAAPPAAERKKQVLVQAAEQANYRATAWAVLAWFGGPATAWFTLRWLMSGAAGFSPLVLMGLTIWFTWEWSRWSWVRSVEATLPGQVEIGAVVPVSVTIDPAKDLTVDKVLIRLRATETSWVKRGKGASRYTRSLVTVQVPLAERISLKPGERLKLEGKLQIPADAPASFSSDCGSVLWTAYLWVALPGFRADIRQKFPVRVAPYRSGARAAKEKPEKWKPLLDLRDCKAEVGLEADLDRNGNFALETGCPARGRLRIFPLEDVDTTAITVDLGYVAQSSAMEEARAVYHQVFPCPHLSKGVEANWEFHVLGLDGPLSFRGAGFFVNWWLTVSVHRKHGPALTGRLPVTVVPGPAP